MKTKEYTGSEERSILTAMVVHEDVLGRIYERVGAKGKPFRSRWSNLVARWCLGHYEKYQKAPRHSIQGVFEDFAQRTNDPESIDLIESFLGGLSEDYKRLAKELNAKHVLDVAARYFQRVRLERLAQSIEEALERNDVEEAQRKAAAHEVIDFSATGFVNPFDDEEISRAFKYYEEDRSLIQFPGALGRFLNPHLARDNFVSFVGPEKRGKSFWLCEVVYQALRQRRRVLYYVLGDMSREEANTRLYCRATGRPTEEQTIYIPSRINIVEGMANVEGEDKSLSALGPKTVRKARERLCLSTGTSEIKLKMLDEGGGVVSASRIEQDVTMFARSGWVSDVVVIDYADELAAEMVTKNLDKRHQINETWRILRRIALKQHLLVVTATQSAKSAYKGKVINKGDFSEDKRKNAHVTGMLGINQTPDEKDLGVYRLNWVLLRDGAWSEHKVVWTAGNLAIARPCIVSLLEPARRASRDNAEDNITRNGSAESNNETNEDQQTSSTRAHGRARVS